MKPPADDEAVTATSSAPRDQGRKAAWRFQPLAQKDLDIPTMATILVADDFRKSCQDFQSYPENIVKQNTITYRHALTTYRLRLDSKAYDLFVDEEHNVDVSFRDMPVTPDEGKPSYCFYFDSIL